MLQNDEKTRRFLAFEIGQGYEEVKLLSLSFACASTESRRTQLKDIVRQLDAELESMRLPRYYENPRFHTSIAWTAIDRDRNDDTLPFGPDQIAELDAKFGKRLRLDELWVGELVLKIGKDLSKYRLAAKRDS